MKRMSRCVIRRGSAAEASKRGKDRMQGNQESKKSGRRKGLFQKGKGGYSRETNKLVDCGAAGQGENTVGIARKVGKGAAGSQRNKSVEERDFVMVLCKRGG